MGKTFSRSLNIFLITEYYFILYTTFYLIVCLFLKIELSSICIIINATLRNDYLFFKHSLNYLLKMNSYFCQSRVKRYTYIFKFLGIYGHIALWTSFANFEADTKYVRWLPHDTPVTIIFFLHFLPI